MGGGLKGSGEETGSQGARSLAALPSHVREKHEAGEVVAELALLAVTDTGPLVARLSVHESGAASKQRERRHGEAAEAVEVIPGVGRGGEYCSWR